MIDKSESMKRPGMHWQLPFGIRLRGLALVIVLLTGSLSDSSYAQTPISNRDEARLSDLITKLRQENELVGLGAMVMVDGEVVDCAVDGERKYGSGVKLEISDHWHVGSVTKSITATMIARLVESGQMQWSDTIGDCFPDASIHEDWKPVTLRQLLTHTAGAPGNFPFWVALNQPALGIECTEARRKAVLNVVAYKPVHPSGRTFAYSNVGYTIAGAMAEKATGLTWEDLVKQEVFEPLELTGAGFGPPKSSAETLEQPRGHSTFWGWKFARTDDSDNTPIIGPAGTVHMTLGDLCTYATEHLRGDLGDGKLLPPETYKLLHKPERSQYACGWVKNEPGAGIPHTMYWHNGSNTMWYALVAFIPEKKMVIAVTSNDGDIAKVEAAAWQVVTANTPDELPNRIPVRLAASPKNPSLTEVVKNTFPFGAPDPHEYPRESPFTAVRWEESEPDVRLGNEWFRLVSLNELPAAEIVAFSQRTYGRRWQKRFEEDLVELLMRMGHQPQDKVTLVVRSLTSSETSVREGVRMTEANRRSIWNAARTREIFKSLRPRVTRPAVSIKDTEQFRGRVNEFMELAHVKAGFSGVVVVAQAGEPVYQRAFGFSHLGFKIPNSLETPFRIASLSKQFTAAAILSLEAEGKLSVDDPVHRYLPEFAAEPYRGITIHHLLTHTSGLPRSPNDAARHARWDAMSEAPTPVNDYVRLACECPLRFAPGQRFQYSNFGYRVLSAVIEQVTGKEYADFMEERLFEPLGLREAGVARLSQPRSEGKVAEELTFVRLDDDTRQPIYVSSESDRNYGTGYGSGGIYTSANDLLRWDRVLAGDSFLPAAQKAKLFQPFRENYACGWVVHSDSAGRLCQIHSGANEGYFSQMMRIPEDDLVIIAVGNVPATEEIDDALEQLFRLCRSLPYEEFGP